LDAQTEDIAATSNKNITDNTTHEAELKPKKISSKSKSSRGFSGIKSKSKLKMIDGGAKRHSEQIQNPFYLEETQTSVEETSPKTAPQKKRATSNPSLTDKRSSVKLPSETSPRKVDVSVTIMPPANDKKVLASDASSNNVEEFDKNGSKEKLIDEDNPKKKEKKKSFRKSKKEGNND